MSDRHGLVASVSNNRLTTAAVSISAKPKKAAWSEVRVGKIIEQKVRIASNSEEKNKCHRVKGEEKRSKKFRLLSCKNRTKI